MEASRCQKKKYKYTCMYLCVIMYTYVDMYVYVCACVCLFYLAHLLLPLGLINRGLRLAHIAKSLDIR